MFGGFGVLLGFIAGYVTHEMVAARQPPRLVAGGAPVAADPSGGGPTPSAGPGATPLPMAEIQRLREHVEQNPNDADAILLLANLNYDIKNWQRAAELYERFLKLRPESPDVLTDLGVTLRELGRFDDALAKFERAAELAPTHWQSRFNQAVVLGLDQGNFARAEKVLADLRVLQPDNASVSELASEIARRRDAAPAGAAKRPGS